MRVCPECRKQYADDVEQCPDDGNALLAADRLPANPELRDVVPVSPTDHTAMIDLEAIEAERERRGLNRPKEPGPANTAEGEAVDDGADDDAEEERRDPDATGTFHVDDLKGRERTQITSAGSVVGDADDDEDDDDLPSGDRTERTELTRRPRLDDPTMGRAAPRGAGAPAKNPGANRAKVLVAAVAAVVVVALGAAVGVWWWVSSRGAVLTVTSVPPGATVLLDGKELGKAPLQDRVAIGSHVIELTLEGYRPFKEVVDVPAEGLPFLQPLEADPGAKASAAMTDGGPSADDEAALESDAPTGVGDAGPSAPASPSSPSADELIAKFDGLLASADYDAALEAIKDLVKHHPDDARADGLFERLADARVKVATSTKAQKQRTQAKRPRSPEQKKREAREAYATGEALYREGNAAEARAKLREAIELDPRFPQPHRAIARIYERDGDIARTRYHLDRYLRLGGKDPDYRVRRWLEDHKGE